MAFARGERVRFDFDSGRIDPVGPREEEAVAPASASFVSDILERNPATVPNPPSAPTLRTNTSGFPVHKKRTARVSAFKQQRAPKDAPTPIQQMLDTAASGPVHGVDIDAVERRQIDEENRQRIAEMSAREIEEERNELLSALSPSLIEKLLNRSNLDDGSNERDLGLEPPASLPEEVKVEQLSSPTTGKKVTFETPELQESQAQESQIPTTSSEPSTFIAPQIETPSAELDSELLHHPDQLPQGGSVHFPTPPQPPDLDPNSPSFLSDLHEKYFPNLPYDPSSLSWMTPIDPSDTTSPYHPSQTAFNASELRFDFKGKLLAPSKARDMPVTAGLHHHADAPEAAGYTIPELARLSRSAVAAQRCVAYQTLGRILYRLGQNEFGEEIEKREVDGPVQIAKDPNQAEDNEDDIADDEDAGSAMASGLWSCIEEGRIIETLTEEAGKERGHLTAKTYAQEALWNWRRGGGRKRKAL